MHPVLLVPELLWPEPSDQDTFGPLAAPALSRLVARGRLARRPRQSAEAVLAEAFGLSDLPAGPLRLLGDRDERARKGHWLCADPVHLRFHHERIILADAGAFDLPADDAHALVAGLNATFGDIGEFIATDPRRWYLRLHTPVDHPAPPLSAVAGRRVEGGPDSLALPLSPVLNEIQMFLHTHPVNAARAARGEPAVNSLWLWGGGTLPQPASDACTSVWTDDPLAVGLAHAAGLAPRPLSAGADAMLAEGGAAPLVILDSLLPPVLYENGTDWRKALEALDRDWLAPLAAAGLPALTLRAATIYGRLDLTLAAADRWKFWRRARPLAALAHTLAGTAVPTHE